MKILATNLPEVLLLEPNVHGDARGFFMESWAERLFNKVIGYNVHFVQDNHSRSAKGVLRGLHYQLPPHAQGKLVRVSSGSVFDVAVDMRRNSPRFGRWTGTELTAENHRQMWIPPGFAHGFLVLSESADFLYKTTDYYAPECEATVVWNDPSIGITWPLQPGQLPVISGKDAAGREFEAALAF